MIAKNAVKYNGAKNCKFTQNINNSIVLCDEMMVAFGYFLCDSTL